MNNLSTNYLGLQLQNPLIVGANNIITNLDNLKRCEDQGAAAIVYKSLFEEQIQLENVEFEEDLTHYDDLHAEMITQHPSLKHSGPDEHLLNLKKAKKHVNIPLIASINAVYRETWIDYAKKIEEVGVDALELNFFAVPKSMNVEGRILEEEQIELLREIKSAVKIPVSVKLSPFYTNLMNIISKMDETGVDGFVIFNRFFQPDINPEEEQHITPFNLSNKESIRLPLRYTGLLYGNIKGNICSSSGIFNGSDVVKMILAGADCVQIVSTLYKNKIEKISWIISELNNWMTQHNYSSLGQFRGKLSNKTISDPFVYKRAQYVDMLMKKADELVNTYPVD